MPTLLSKHDQSWHALYTGLQPVQRLSIAAGRQDKGRAADFTIGTHQLSETAQALTDDGHMLESRQVAGVTGENGRRAGKRVCTRMRKPLSARTPYGACTAV